jgi:hypothetical protein
MQPFERNYAHAWDCVQIEKKLFVVQRIVSMDLLEELGTCHCLKKFYVHGRIISYLVSIYFFLCFILKVLGYVDILWV